MPIKDFHEQQPHIVSLLLQELHLSRLSHAYLFYGQEGLGKLLLAKELAKAANCLRGDDACGTCISCQKVHQNNHPDIKILEPEGASLKIGQIRRLQKDVYYKPYEGKKKVYLIPKSHLLTVEAQNCLLKTLEEPPAYAILILITENKDALLSTIRSRCQLFHFPRQREDLTESFTNKTPIQELGEGELLLQEEIMDHFFSLMGAGYTEIFQRVEEIDKKYNQKMDQVCSIFLSLFRDLLLLKTGGEGLTHHHQEQQLRDLSESFSWDMIQEMMKVVEKIHRDMKRNVSKRLALEVMCLKIRGRGGLVDEKGRLGYL